MSRAVSQMLADQYYNSMVAARRRGPLWSVTDLGELAARLGSPVTFDRRGDVCLIDNFDEGILKWVSNAWGAGGSVSISPDRARHGAWSVKMVAGSDGYRMAQIYQVMAFPARGKLGMECAFAFDAELDWFGLLFDLYDGEYFHEPLVVYDYSNLHLWIRNGAGEVVDLATGLDLYVPYYPFWLLKVVVDFESVKYMRVLLNNTEYDVSGVSYLRSADSSNARLRVGVKSVGQEYLEGEYNAVVYVDDVIVTQNEPEN